MPKYTEEMIQKAIEEIISGAPKKTVAKKYGIPRATLQFRLSSKFNKIEKGPNTYLTKDEEFLLQNWLIECQTKGFPRIKEDVKHAVKAFF